MKLSFFRTTLFLMITTFTSSMANAALLTWTFEFEVQKVSDGSNDYLDNDVNVGDILIGTLSYDSNLPKVFDNDYVSDYEGDSLFIDIAGLTTDAFTSLAEVEVSTIDQDFREIVDTEAEAVNGTLEEYLEFTFIDNVNKYETAPTTWHQVPVGDIDFEYELDDSVLGGLIDIEGVARSVTLTVVPEPGSLSLLALGLLTAGFTARRRQA